MVRDFGGMAGLKEAMRKAALGQFGSGWAWLSADGDGRLAVQKTANQDTPLPLCPRAVLRRVGARLLSPIPEPPGGLLRGLVAAGGLA